MDGPDRIGKEEMKEFVESYRDELIELVRKRYMMNRSYMISNIASLVLRTRG